MHTLPMALPEWWLLLDAAANLSPCGLPGPTSTSKNMPNMEQAGLPLAELTHPSPLSALAFLVVSVLLAALCLPASPLLFLLLLLDAKVESPLGGRQEVWDAAGGLLQPWDASIAEGIWLQGRVGEEPFPRKLLIARVALYGGGRAVRALEQKAATQPAPCPNARHTKPPSPT